MTPSGPLAEQEQKYVTKNNCSCWLSWSRGAVPGSDTRKRQEIEWGGVRGQMFPHAGRNPDAPHLFSTAEKQGAEGCFCQRSEWNQRRPVEDSDPPTPSKMSGDLLTRLKEPLTRLKEPQRFPETICLVSIFQLRFHHRSTPGRDHPKVSTWEFGQTSCASAP